MTAQKNATQTLQQFLADHAAIRVWHSGFDAPAGSQTEINTDTECDEDYCDAESLLSVLTDWLSLDLDAVEGESSQDSDGEWRWEWTGGEDLRNCKGNSISKIVVWAE